MVLEHLESPHTVLKEIARVLAPGGKFVFLTPHLGNPWVRISYLGAAADLASPLIRVD
jgi:ubiquinone/menaquinone biosynthesis C-methylase UbiE